MRHWHGGCIIVHTHNVVIDTEVRYLKDAPLISVLYSRNLMAKEFAEVMSFFCPVCYSS